LKLTRISFLLALLLAFVPVVALAAQQESKTFTLDQKAMVGSQQLKPGDYKVKWDDSSDSTTVTFYKNNKEVASAPAHIVRRKNSNYDSYELNTTNGNQIDRIYEANEVLEFGNSTASASTGIAPTQ